MEEWVRDIIESEKEKRNIPLEAKKLNNNYYLYKATTRYDKKNKKIRKVSLYIGRITPGGIVEKRVMKRSVYEYGNSELITSLSRDIIALLQKHFPDKWNDIYSYSVAKLLCDIPMKSVKERFDKLYMSRTMDAHLSPESLSDLLKQVGSDVYSQNLLFSDLMENSNKLAFDLSSIFSQSVDINMAERGHNHEHLYLNQINMVMVFDTDRYMPVSLKPLEGSIRDIKALKKELENTSYNGIIVIDRGFTSHELMDTMDNKNIKFIMPLRRNEKDIDYNMHFNKSFIYRNRGIMSGVVDSKNYKLYMFYDPMLAGEESSTYITLITVGKRENKDYENESIKFGKIAIMSNIDGDPEKIYLMYKERDEIEKSFDAMKNNLENDKSYLRDDGSLRGYFFISFISLYIYYNIFVLVKAAGLTSRYSVKDVLLKFSRVYRIIENKKEYTSEIPASVEKLDKILGTNIFPKN